MHIFYKLDILFLVKKGNEKMIYLLSGIALLGVLLLLVLIYKLEKTAHLQKENFLSQNLEQMERRSHEDASTLRQDLLKTIETLNNSLKGSVDAQFEKIRSENAQKLEKMRETVDENLHNTLEKRIGQSFAQVSERLEKVHQGLGEMQSLASGVGDLKRVLTNVKTRGTWGEIQLASLLEQVLTADQFRHNVKIKQGTTEVVEYAIVLPGTVEGQEVLIPIDSKFPMEDYERLMKASEDADAAGVERAAVELERSIKTQAHKISSKYISPPTTTDFALMFLPTEGLYAEVMKRPGLAQELQHKERIVIAGPSTLGAFLSSLQMGFRSLAIQKRSGEVWKVLSEAQQEFKKYGDWVDKVKNQLGSVVKTLDMADRRTRAVERRLNDVEGQNLESKPPIDEISDLPFPKNKSSSEE